MQINTFFIVAFDKLQDTSTSVPVFSFLTMISAAWFLAEKGYSRMPNNDYYENEEGARAYLYEVII